MEAPSGTRNYKVSSLYNVIGELHNDQKYIIYLFAVIINLLLIVNENLRAT